MFSLAQRRDIINTISEFFLHLFYCEKSCFVGFVGCAILWDLLGEQNSKVFSGLERDPSNIWSFVLDLVFLFGLRFLKIIYTYLLGAPFFSGFPLYAFLFFHLVSMKVVVIIKKK